MHEAKTQRSHKVKCYSIMIGMVSLIHLYVYVYTLGDIAVYIGGWRRWILLSEKNAHPQLY